MKPVDATFGRMVSILGGKVCLHVLVIFQSEKLHICLSHDNYSSLIQPYIAIVSTRIQRGN